LRHQFDVAADTEFTEQYLQQARQYHHRKSSGQVALEMQHDQ
jgi:hypothetical protein